jgi:hypothetical protein
MRLLWFLVNAERESWRRKGVVLHGGTAKLNHLTKHTLVTNTYQGSCFALRAVDSTGGGRHTCGNSLSAVGPRTTRADGLLGRVASI